MKLSTTSFHLVIQTPRLILRPLKPEDAKVLFEYRSDPRVYEYQSWEPGHINEALQFIEQYSNRNIIDKARWNQFGIYSQKSGELIGDCGFCFIEKEQVEIGFTIAPRYQRQGYGKESVNSLIDFLFKSIKIHRIIASTDPDNVNSISLLKRLGFRQECHFKKSLKVRGEWKDDLQFALLKEEWIKLNIQTHS